MCSFPFSQQLFLFSNQSHASTTTTTIQYKGPVTTSIVTRKVQTEHPSWKLNDKRMNKFIKRFMDSHRNVAGADDDQTASFRSSKKGLFGRLSSRKLSSVDDGAAGAAAGAVGVGAAAAAAVAMVASDDTSVPSTTSPKAATATDPVETVESKKSEQQQTPEVAESDSGDATPVPSYPEEDEAVVEKSASSNKEIAYHTDNTVVDASQDCWGLGNQCSIM